ncbi:MAG: dCTP deaminase [Sarcina sp.]
MLVHNQILDRVNNYKKYKAVYENKPSPLIENFSEKNLQSISYDISMTNKIMKFRDEFKTIYLNEKDHIDNLFEEESIVGGYKLRPNEYILVKIKEKINMPSDLGGHIRPRTTFNKIGVIITAQHLNPSYSGHLQIGLRNVTPNVIVLTPNLIIGQIIFETLDGKIQKEMLYENKLDSKYNNEDEFVGSKVYDETSIKKAEELYEKLIGKSK